MQKVLAAALLLVSLSGRAQQFVQVDPDEQVCLNDPKFTQCVEARRVMRREEERYAAQKAADLAARNAVWEKYVEVPLKAKCLDRRGKSFDACLEKLVAPIAEDLRGTVKWQIKSEYEEIVGAQIRKACSAAKREQGTAWIGMTEEQAIYCGWGRPSDVNRTITSGRVSEQWVYGDSGYLYFVNGRLTAIQN